MAKRNIKFVERRSHLRLPMNIGARLQLPNQVVIQGKTRNISFSGTFVELEKTPLFEVGDYFSLRLFASIEFTVKVIHFNREGVGFQFDFILIKYYEHFKKMMLRNAPDPDRLIKELGRQPDQCLLCRDDNGHSSDNVH